MIARFLNHQQYVWWISCKKDDKTHGIFGPLGCNLHRSHKESEQKTLAGAMASRGGKSVSVKVVLDWWRCQGWNPLLLHFTLISHSLEFIIPNHPKINYYTGPVILLSLSLFPLVIWDLVVWNLRGPGNAMVNPKGEENPLRTVKKHECIRNASPNKPQPYGQDSP